MRLKCVSGRVRSRRSSLLSGVLFHFPPIPLSTRLCAELHSTSICNYSSPSLLSSLFMSSHVFVSLFFSFHPISSFLFLSLPLSSPPYSSLLLVLILVHMISPHTHTLTPILFFTLIITFIVIFVVIFIVIFIIFSQISKVVRHCTRVGKGWKRSTTCIIFP